MQGTGMSNDPYVITTRGELEGIGNDLGAFYELGNDIDLGNVEWEMIGNGPAKFTGSFDGKGCTIRNLKITQSTVYGIGLFGYVDGAVIKNVNIENVDVQGRNYVGALVGCASNSLNIDNCRVEGEGRVKGYGSSVGGLIGMSIYGEINNSSSKINVENSGDETGGLGGHLYQTQISRCYASGEVICNGSQVGGLIGTITASKSHVSITESYGLGNVIGVSKVGGLIGEGRAYNGNMMTVENCFALGDVTSSHVNYAYTGGLIGYLIGERENNSVVKNSYSVGKINSSTATGTGGLIGYISYTNFVSCYYDGTSSQHIPTNQYDISKLTSSMKSQVTFVDWDFSDIWEIEEGNSYPYLKNLPKPNRVSTGLPENEIAGGDGSSVNPYIIETKEQLDNIKYDVIAHYELGSDIDLENMEWEPIGKSGAKFTGSLDGKGYTISNLKITQSTVYGTGLFGYVDGAVIKNVNIENVDVQGKNYVGALVGCASNSLNIDNCRVEGEGRVKGYGSSVGGLIGISIYGEINNSSSKINVENSGDETGGLGGHLYQTQISRCYASGEVICNGSQVGGLIGTITASKSHVSITESYGLGNVIGVSKVGGLIGEGRAYNGNMMTVENCFALGDVTSSHVNYAYTGGLIGYLIGERENNSVVKNSYSVGKINSSTATGTGGLIGYISYTNFVSCYYDSINTGFITPSEQAKTTEQLMKKDTFDNWDFIDIWNIAEENSYPFLNNLPIPEYVGMPENLAKIESIDISTTMNSITLSWNTVDKATGYDIEIDGVVVNNGNNTSYIHSGLEKGTEHTYRVRAKNNSIKGEWSDLITASTFSVETPKNVNISVSQTTISVSWDSVVEATGYDIEVDGVIVDNDNNTSYIHSGLEKGTEHTYRVRAKNNSIKGEWSDLITASTFSVETPKNVNISVSQTTITISWDPIVEVIGYDVEVDGVVVDNGDNTKYVHSGLEQGTKHTYKVRAKDEKGTSGWSDVVTETVPYIGTPENPYIITNREELKGIDDDLSAYYQLGNNIDLENSEWIPIGNSGAEFTGSLDGKGYTVRNLKITQPILDGIGLFGYVNGGQIKNLNIEDVDIKGRSNVGPLAGYAHYGFNIDNCRVEGAGKVKGDSYVGGLIGIVQAYGQGKINNCSTKIRVEGSKDYIGGLVGHIKDSRISRCYTEGDINSLGSRAGGLIGYVDTNITYSSIKESYAVGNVEGINSVGGLIGEGSGYRENRKIIVENCFALGNVTSSDKDTAYAGGLIGNLNGYHDYESIVTKSYSAGKVSGASNIYIGGLIGGVKDIEVDGYYDGIASKCVSVNEYGISKLTSGMKTQVTFIDWDFDNIWDIEEGKSYPYLKSLLKPLKASDGLPENEVAEGVGIVEDPYIIETKEQLDNMRHDLVGHYRLRNDIDLESIEWEPIGSWMVQFTGSLDGNGYTIRNLKITKPEAEKIGLFAYIHNANIKNLNIEDVDIEGRIYVGVLAANAQYGFNIDNCRVQGAGKVKGDSYVGGLIGIVQAYGQGKINNCSTKIRVEGSKDYIGGLVGHIKDSRISRCYTEGDINSLGSRAGGLIGYVDTNITYSSIKESYAVGNVEGINSVGGLIGEGSGYRENRKIIVENCFALGNVTSSDKDTAYAGGLIGNLNGYHDYESIVTKSYSAGKVSGASNIYIGGLIGYEYYGTITNCYYDSTNTGFTTPPEQAKTKENLMKKPTFINWDFIDIWDIDEESSYPFLRSLPVPEHENMIDHLMPVNLRVIRKTGREITIRWDAVPEAHTYEIMVDGVVINNGADRTYTHENLSPDSIHEYRVRAKNDHLMSSWSPRLFVRTLLDTPQNVKATLIDNSIVITWDPVEGATQYVVEINGEQTYTVNTTSYTHSNVEENKVQFYRVRAINQQGTSEWSEVVSAINWPKDKPSICLSTANWKSYIDENDELEIIIKANGFSDFYTMQLYLQYDSNRVTPDLTKTKSLIDINEENKYFSILDDKVLKILLSATGDIKGKQGEFDVASIKIELDAYRETSIDVDIIKLVNSMASYIDIAKTVPLKIKQLTKIEY